MQAFTKMVAGGLGLAALAGAAPAAAQYYQNYGYGSPYGAPQSVYGAPGYGYNGYGYNSYGANGSSQVAINQCTGAVQARLSGGYGNYGYNGYGYSNSGRVLGVSRVEPRANGLTVRGVATSGRYAAYGNGQSTVDLTWRCRVDYRGYVSDVSIDRAQPNYGYGNYAPYGTNTPYNGDYSEYGYRRY